MNIVYLLGIVLAFVFVIFGITFDPGGTGGLMVGPFNLDTLINFVDPTSILIVLGGTLAVVVACYPKLAKSFPKHFKIMLRLDAFNPEADRAGADCPKERPACLGGEGQGAGGPLLSAGNHAHCRRQRPGPGAQHSGK